MREVTPGVPPGSSSASTTRSPNFRNFDFKDRSSTATRCPRDLLGWITLYAGAYIGRRARRSGWPPSAPGTSSEAEASATAGSRSCCPSCRWLSRPHRPAGRDLPCPGGGALPAVGRAGEAPVAGLRGPHGRRLLAAHGPVLRRPAALLERQALRAAAAPDRDHDHARPAASSWPTATARSSSASRRPWAPAGRARASRCWSGRTGPARLPGGCARIWASSTSCSWATPPTAARVLVEASQIPGAAFWLGPGGRPARQGRRSRELAPDVAPDVRAGGGGHHPARTPGCACRSSTRSTLRDRLAAAVAEFERRHGGAPRGSRS